MPDREFRRYNIDQLEKLFASSSTDLGTIESLLYELSFRKTGRAKKLLDAIEAQTAQTAEPTQVIRKDVKTSALKAEVLGNDLALEANSGEVSVDPVDDWAAELARIDGIVNCGEKANKNAPNQPDSILDAWTALEALSPQSYKKESDLRIGLGEVVPMGRDMLEPWSRGLKSIKDHQLYFHVYLGAIRLDRATEALLKVFGDDTPERWSSNGFASLGVVVVDRNGRLVSDESIAISSFGWAFGMILHGEIDRVRDWNRAESIIKERLLKMLSIENEDGEVAPLTMSRIYSVYQWMVGSYRLSEEYLVSPSFAVKVLHRFGLDEPEPPLLNSFYIEDLQKAKACIASKNAGSALELYIEAMNSDSKVDLLQEQQAVDRLLAPKLAPVGRWPSNGRHSLVLLQQLAVNLANSELADSGIASVNGPPGTGKTTLLRDLVAMNVVGRAKALCAFESPESAFKHRGSTRVSQAHVHFYDVDETIRGYEMLVASSNNKAVENISKELPLIDAVASDLPPPRYFRTASDNLNEADGSTWGLIAAVLGNSKNRAEFKDRALWDENAGMMHYLRAIASGMEQVGDAFPSILEEEDPPTDLYEAKSRWKTRREDFLKSYNKSEKAIQVVQQAKEHLDSLDELASELKRLDANFKQHIQVLEDRKLLLSEYESIVLDQQNQSKRADKNESSHQALRPGFFSRLFRTRLWQNWKQELKDFCEEAIRCRKQLLDGEQELSRRRALYHQKREQCVELQKAKDAKAEVIEARKAFIQKASGYTGDRLIGPSFWKMSHSDRQQHIPNFSDAVQKLRDDVFRDAFELHKAFVDAAAKPIRHNLMALFSSLSGRSIKGEKADVLPSLWSTLFLLVPVVSSTFASIGRMMGALPSQSIGWLLVDEAGQATPQAAVGAIMRSRRAFVVGDPLQIEPVVSLSTSLVEKLAELFAVDAEEWCAPYVSVQSLADRSSKFGARIQTSQGELTIGSPLLVHRRCEDPMFSISNDLAYDGKMVKATKDKPSAISQVVGPSQWIHVEGESNDKWCAEEAEEVVRLFKMIASSLGEVPDLFIITPFRVVAQNMRSRMRQERSLFDRLGVSCDEWAKDRIGTVHTFQGKEAEAVIFLLGAPMPAQRGARNWATSTVNLINVAVSRAKQAIYVVGNRREWGTTGCASVLNGRL